MRNFVPAALAWLALTSLAVAAEPPGGQGDARWGDDPQAAEEALRVKLEPAPLRLRFGRRRARARFLLYRDRMVGSDGTFTLRFDRAEDGGLGLSAVQVRLPRAPFERAVEVAAAWSIRCGEPVRTAMEVPIEEGVDRTDRWSWDECGVSLRWAAGPGGGATLDLHRLD